MLGIQCKQNATCPPHGPRGAFGPWRGRGSGHNPVQVPEQRINARSGQPKSRQRATFTRSERQKTIIDVDIDNEQPLVGPLPFGTPPSTRLAKVGRARFRVALLRCGLHPLCVGCTPGLRTALLLCALHPWFASCTLRGLQLASPWFAASTLPVCWLHHTLPVCWLHHTLPVCWLHMPLSVGCTPCVWAAPHVCGLHPLCVGCTPFCHTIVCVAPLCRTPQLHPCARASKSALPTQSVPAPVEKNWCADLHHCTKLASDLLPTKHLVAMPLISPHFPSFLRSKDLDAGVSATSPPPKGDPTLHKPWEEPPRRR